MFSDPVDLPVLSGSIFIIQGIFSRKLVVCIFVGAVMIRQENHSEGLDIREFYPKPEAETQNLFPRNQAGNSINS
jgi:hypothetical protein